MNGESGASGRLAKTAYSRLSQAPGWRQTNGISGNQATGRRDRGVQRHRADLATFDGVEELYQAIQAAGRAPEALAINAGVGVAGDFARDNELADELGLIGLNVTGAVHLVKRVLPGMIALAAGVCCSRPPAPRPPLVRITRPTPRPRRSCCPSPRRSGASCGTPA